MRMMMTVYPGRRARITPLISGRMLAVLSLLILLLSVPSCDRFDRAGREVRRVTPDRIQRFESGIRRLQRELKIPGMAIAVLEDGEIVWTRGFGLADRERCIPVTPDTPFQLASVTKALASVVVLGAEERGLLSMSDRVMDCDPVFPFERLNIEKPETLLLRHLITHTSDGPPGSRYRYDGDLYCNLDLPLYLACGQDFRELFLERIATPLGMSRTAPNPVDPGLLDRFQNWMRARGDEPVMRDPSGQPYETSSLRTLNDEAFERGYLLIENMLPGAIAAAGGDSTLFLVRVPRSVSDETRERFNEFFREDNSFQEIYAEMARPYRFDEQAAVVRGGYRNFFSTGTGFISTVRDLAAFDIALDDGRLVTKETLQRAWTPFVLADGRPTLYGLGWFVEEFGGRQLIWHGGEWDCTAALYLKVPAEDVTLIALANNRSMSGGFAMAQGTVLNSGLGLDFLRIFVFEPGAGATGPDIDWRDDPAAIRKAMAGVTDEHLRSLWWHQLRNTETMLYRMLDARTAERLVQSVHKPLFEQVVGVPHADLTAVAEIVDVGNGEHRTVDFDLECDSAVCAYAIGEITDGGCWDWGWIERIPTGEVVWEMTWSNTIPGGGSFKNRKADASLQLAAGEYRLHYQSDDSHAYMDWNAPPPDHPFWGISILRSQGPS